MLLLSNMKKMDNKQMERLGYWVLAVAVILAGIYFFNSVSKVGTVAQPAPVSLDDHIRGGTATKVVLVEYGDFQCPACGAYEPMVQTLLKNHPADVQFVFRHFPLTNAHKNAMLAAEISEAAGIQGKFWEMHDAIYAHQKDWSDSLNAKEILLGYAKEIGLDTAKMETDLKGGTIDEKILAQAKEGVKIGINSTPSFFVNGTKITNPQSIEAFEKIITDAEQGK